MPHVTSSTDFLLVRTAAGQLALRELTGCITVGQQHPSQVVWAPMSAEALAYERTRFKVRVHVSCFSVIFVLHFLLMLLLCYTCACNCTFYAFLAT